MIRTWSGSSWRWFKALGIQIKKASNHWSPGNVEIPPAAPCHQAQIDTTLNSMLGSGIYERLLSCRLCLPASPTCVPLYRWSTRWGCKPPQRRRWCRHCGPWRAAPCQPPPAPSPCLASSPNLATSSKICLKAYFLLLVGVGWNNNKMREGGIL